MASRELSGIPGPLAHAIIESYGDELSGITLFLKRKLLKKLKEGFVFPHLCMLEAEALVMHCA